jgi:4-carboxymuconolactone decarboxylase
MARVPYVDPASAPAPVREQLAHFGADPLNVFRVLAHAESCFAPVVRLGGAILLEQTLDARLRELAILRVARLEDAPYEWTQHVAIAEGVGVPAAHVAALRADDATAGCFDDRERLVLAATTELVRSADVDDATWAALAAHLSPRELVELVIAVGFYMLMARVMRATRIDMDAPVGLAGIGRGR